MLIPMAANDCWSLGLRVGSANRRRRFRVLTVVDDCTRGCLGLVAGSRSSLRVARELDRIIGERGKPTMIVSDNGSEFTSDAILQWADRTKVYWHYIASGADPGFRLSGIADPVPQQSSESGVAPRALSRCR